MASDIRVACLLGEGFEDSEFRVPYDRMKKAGIDVDIVSTEAGKELKGYRGKETIRTEKSIQDVNPDSYSALFIPGGYSPDHLRANPRVVDWVRSFDGLKRPIAAVCHGPQLLMSAGLVKGRTMTAWTTVQSDLRLAGANVKDEPVVRDGNWITSRNPGDLDQFSEAIVRTLH